MQTPDYSISTPENVDLHLELAGIGNRILACLIDTFITGIAISVIAIASVIAALAMEQLGVADEIRSLLILILVMVGVLVSFFIIYAYYVYFEGAWSGQTPGKRIAQIRVIESNGQPVGWSAVFIRNLIRVLDMGLLMIGLLVMVINKNERRIGDLAAGTLVIRERKQELGSGEIKILTAAKSDSLIDVGRITPQEYDLLARYLKRRLSLSESHRPAVAARLEKYFREKLDENGMDETKQVRGSKEEFLERVYLSYKSRGDDLI